MKYTNLYVYDKVEYRVESEQIPEWCLNDWSSQQVAIQGNQGEGFHDD